MRTRIVLSLLILALATPALARTSAAPDTGALAPDFQLPIHGGTVSLAALRGKVVLVDFWASWCVPCRHSFPWMSELHERFGPKGLVVVAINLDKERPAAAAFLEQFPAKFAIAYDPAGRTAEAYQVSVMPSSFVIGRDGTILHRHAGFDPRKTRAVEDLIQEACSR